VWRMHLPDGTAFGDAAHVDIEIVVDGSAGGMGADVGGGGAIVQP
jgi:hypothetical protein